MKKTVQWLSSLSIMCCLALVGCDLIGHPDSEESDRANAGVDIQNSRPTRPKEAILGHWKRNDGALELYVSEGGEKDLLFTYISSDGRVKEEFYIVAGEDLGKREVELNYWFTESQSSDRKAKIGTFSDGRIMRKWFIVAPDGRSMSLDYLHFSEGRQPNEYESYAYVDSKGRP
jgi:hypothetical protein